MNNKLIIYLFLLISPLLGCYKTIDKMGNSANQLVLGYPAVNQFNTASSGLNFWSNALITPDMGKSTALLVFSLNISRPLNQDITINIGIDKSAVDAYNANPISGVTYELMPDNYYQIVNSSIVLPAGQTDTTFEVEIKPSIFDISQTGYLLPVTITSVSGIEVNNNMKTAYIHINKDPFPPYGRGNWTVEGFDSQEEVGEGPNNGRVINLFDDKTSTFWHTQWKDGQPGLPHWFIINMNTEHVLHGIMFLDRQGVGSPGRPKDVVVEVSADNVTWEEAGRFTLADDNSSWQKITFNKPTQSVRYFKVTVNSTYGGTYYTNLAELKVF